MSNFAERVTLAFAGETIEIDGYPGQGMDTSDAVPTVDDTPWYVLTSGRIVGWWDTPALKTSVTERGAGDGSFPVPDNSVFYATRTVTLNVGLMAGSREGVQGLMDGLLRMAHRTVRMTVHDAGVSTYVDGFCTVTHGTYISDEGQTALVTLTCPDPRRYAVTPSVGFLTPTATGGLGIGFDDETGVIDTNPVTFLGEGGSNACTVYNNGTSVAYPTITASMLPSGLTVTEPSTGRQVSYSQPIGTAPLVIDSLSRTASVAGVDATRHLTQRDFFSIEPGGSLTLVLNAAGSGTVTVECRDTYI